jgi:hypothetical protein
MQYILQNHPARVDEADTNELEAMMSEAESGPSMPMEAVMQASNPF